MMYINIAHTLEKEQQFFSKYEGDTMNNLLWPLKPYILALTLAHNPVITWQVADTLSNTVHTLEYTHPNPYHIERDETTQSGSMMYQWYTINFSHDGIISYSDYQYQLETNNLLWIDISIRSITWHDDKMMLLLHTSLGTTETYMTSQYVDSMCHAILTHQDRIPLGSSQKARLKKIT